MQRKHEMDMCSGPLLGKTLQFALPLMCSSVLQLLFNAMDLVVAGKFAGSDALAAVGATGALINLIINVLMGLSIGTNVIVARYYGAGDREAVSRASNTSIIVSGAGGVAVGILGMLLSRPLLALMSTPPDILDQAAAYMRIYFCGLPVMALYNFGASILRSVGDTRRPLYYLIVAGVLNVGMNLIFTICFHMGVKGVALATVLAQCVSTFLVMRALMQKGTAYTISREKLRMDKSMFRLIAGIGVPAGINGMVFSVSNALIQSSINYFGSTVVAGCSAASNIESFLFCAQDAFNQSALAFTSQNLGARRYDRINKIFVVNIVLVCICCALGGAVFLLWKEPLMGIYSSDAAVIAAGAVRLGIIGTSYCFCGIMNTMVGMIRGMGYSLLPTVVSMAGACGLRIIWIYTIFAAHKTLSVLFWSYPVSWGITAAIHMICYFVLKRRMKKRWLAADETVTI